MGITLTHRNNGAGAKGDEMAGFPHHALDSDELAAATAGYKEVHKVEGADHACSRHVLGEEAYTEIVGAFLRNIT